MSDEPIIRSRIGAEQNLILSFCTHSLLFRYTGFSSNSNVAASSAKLHTQSNCFAFNSLQYLPDCGAVSITTIGEPGPATRSISLTVPVFKYSSNDILNISQFLKSESFSVQLFVVSGTLLTLHNLVK